MFSKIILYFFIALFIFMFFIEIGQSSSIIEGLTTDANADASGDSGGADSSDNLGITVGRYTSKIDQLSKTIDSMQASILGLLPTVAKNTQDNAKNQQAIQAIIANKNKT
jgi:hypothetical protein